MTNTPIVNRGGFKYVDDLEVTNGATARLVGISAGSARSSDNLNDIVLDAAVEIDADNNGVNGLDVGALANNTFYAVYVIGDSTGFESPAGIVSTNISAPTLPFGYDMSRRIAWVLTDGSADFLPFQQKGTGRSRLHCWEGGISVLSAGADTSFTAVPLSAGVPPGTEKVFLEVVFDGDAATDTAALRSFGATAAGGQTSLQGTAAGVTRAQRLLPAGDDAGVPSIEYKVNAGTLSLSLSFFYDEI